MSHNMQESPGDAAPAPGAPHCGGDAQNCSICGNGLRNELDFSFAYQPIVDLPAGRIFAHEALVRGPDGQSAASVLDRIGEATRYSFDQACRVKAIDLACDYGLLERGGEKLSINFLPHAVYRPEVCIQTTLQAARKRGMEVSSIVFEVTEGERIEDGPWFAEILREYRRQGFLTAIDDFGAGYAGLRLLADFQPDLIKLDMDLVRDVDKQPARQAIARSVIRLAQELGIALVVEGVETPGERDFFLHEGVALFQGYLFSRPAFQGLARVADWG